ncbi:unannotated protein [freshwater metagenome]|uniref:Unannotated protein n=1 Tax=freshwater metagenome TaxID=449393 RepID=A0A6J7RXI3_9ZZZZ
MILDHRVGVQHVRADLRTEVDVLTLALLGRDLIGAEALLKFEQLCPQHLHCSVLVRRLRALVLALNDYPARAVSDPHRGVGLVDVLTTGAGSAVGVDLEIIVLDRHALDLVDDRRDFNTGK